MAMHIGEEDDDPIVAEINITPLTDVFLVLLIIFMVTSSVMMEQGLNVKLPKAKTTTLTKSTSGKPIYISIDKTGKISVNNRITEEKQLLGVLKNALAENKERLVIIRGDEKINLGKAIKIMDMAREAGASKIALATQPDRR